MDVIHHGHLVGLYPRSVTRTEARARLGVSGSAFVYLFFGACKPYKGLEELILAFADVPGDCALLIAGRFTDAEYQRTVEALAKSDPRVTVAPRFIPDDEVQNYLVACDVVVVPYRDILTSATVMLAFAFGRPAVSVRLGCLPDVVPTEAGLLYEPDTLNGLRNALVDVRGLRFSEESVIAHALRFDWEAPARALVNAYRGGAVRDA
jgi:glycosyltransferase involved in cell wall biosynthesis